MNKEKIKAILAGLSILGGSAFVGSEISRPDCDYVILTEDKQEICMTEEQALEMLKSKSGFGGTRMGGTPIIRKE